ncbi:MAG TPA: site-specific integrase [Isosphaeraceae bacterium]|jgi:integrase|nr:site-specific integrase [Isosphaeraceae bacterium]
MPARKRSPRPPSYRLHRPSGQAVVTLSGKDHYLGKHGSPESREAYDRLVAEWLSRGRRPPAGPATAAGPTVNEVILAYCRFAESYYRNADGTSAPELDNVRLSLRPIRQLYGRTPAADFGPSALKAIRETLVAAKLARVTVNQRVARIVRVFAWAVESELVPPSVHHGLAAVRGLRKGRGGAREGRKVRPVPDADVAAVRPFVGRQVWGLIEFQRLTGCRSGEACRLRTRDLDMGGPVWTYNPPGHKTDIHGHARTIYVGPRAQEALRPWLRPDEPDAYLFSPAEAMAEHRARRRAVRKSKVQPSQRSRAKARPGKAPGPRYSVGSYRRAIQAACAKAGVPRWFPHQLRHAAATRLRRDFGPDVAKVVLGHSSPTVVETYAAADRAKAVAAMGAVG